MRGYEFLTVRWVLPPAGCYFSPWGVMSPGPHDSGNKWRSLFLPMRGYEDCLVDFSACQGALFLPMRGYEKQKSSGGNRCPSGYFSPWGVMRSQSREKLKNGAHVISPHEGLWADKRVYWEHSTARYFSPWGVMSGVNKGLQEISAKLFLPMRGYELSIIKNIHRGLNVISPHEGLWVWFVPLNVVDSGRYFSPWGVMRKRQGYFLGFSGGYFSPWGVMRCL